MTIQHLVPAKDLGQFVAELFEAAGLSVRAAERVSDALIEADLSGRSSHGVLQADNYLARLVAGAMSTAEQPRIISESGGAVVLDAAGMEGHLAAEEAIAIAIAKAQDNGVAAVAVRRGQHMGVAGRYVRMAAEAGCAALAMGNTKPVMPAPGGAERLVGTNPIAIGIPTTDHPIVLDMATSAGTYGRIRHAHAAGQTLPEGWALDAYGRPTTDPAAAMKGLLLPMGGAKGFALSFAIDLMAGLLSSGAWGAKLGELDDDTTKPQLSSYLFIVLDIAHFRPLSDFLEEADEAVRRVRQSRRAEGVERLFTPGERSAEALEKNNGMIELAPTVAHALRERAQALGVAIPRFMEEHPTAEAVPRQS
ncbi:Ldh family oxidoreductase [Chelativorans sp. AA-79]|uniref:Ldh family oxidoreductase n=1 Tax=Chelativorans sp. AA-79 TaxID=3028735 RepID=UPI0023F7CA9F|nr:Ldh family oxidoreductase [Chelativorans sp. AA-79]WEX10921.1 Ldh family oxidoreductase [Chelativorans sp. AA-79]